jgi:hypothetical protein
LTNAPKCDIIKAQQRKRENNMKKKTIVINGKEYQEIENTTVSDLIGMTLAVVGVSVLLVGTFGTVVLALLGLA